MAFIVGDKWQNLGLGTKMVDYTLDLATKMGVESVYAIMLPDNYRALSLTKKMGFDIEYLGDGTVKGSLSLKEDVPDQRCLLIKNLQETLPEVPQETQPEKAKIQEPQEVRIEKKAETSQAPEATST
jgi:hypothetical protein